jgi:hypothetical protein
MEFNRNQFFFLGMFILMLGLQARMVQSYTLSAEATQFLAQRSGGGSVASASNSPGAFIAANAPPSAITRKTVHPPEWLGWCLISIGSVLILHSLAMPRPS